MPHLPDKPARPDPEARRALRILYVVIGLGMAALLAGYYCFTSWGP